jgi:hypothetical protein
MIRIARMAALAAAIVAAAMPASAGAGSAPAEIQFEKTFDLAATVAGGAPTWRGTAAGAAVGTVETRLLSVRETGSVSHLSAEWTVTAGERSFTARVAGIYNSSSQIIVLNGVVTDGWMEGAQIHERGVRPDPNVSRYIGTLTLVGGGR